MSKLKLIFGSFLLLAGLSDFFQLQGTRTGLWLWATGAILFAWALAQWLLKQRHSRN